MNALQFVLRFFQVFFTKTQKKYLLQEGVDFALVGFQTILP